MKTGNVIKAVAEILSKIRWLFQRENCKHCCLWCGYYNLCRADVLAQSEREENHGKERAGT